MANTLLLSESQVRELISIDDAIEIVESVFKAHGLGQVVMPPKAKLDLGEGGAFPNLGSFMNALPAYVGGEFNLVGVKWAGGFSANRERNLPYIIATIIITDPSSGLPLAIMGGTYITGIRTAAASAVGVKYLAKQGASKVTIFGAGVQGRFHCLSISKVLKPHKIAIVDVNMKAAGKLSEEMGKDYGIKTDVISNVAEAVRDSDVLVTVTDSKIPFLEKEWIQPGTLVCAVGSKQELTDNALKSFDRIIVDNVQQNINAGNLKSPFSRGIITDANVYSEIGPIVAGKKSGRNSLEDKILFVHIGLGSLDVAAGTRVYRRAVEKRMGTPFQLVP